VKEKRESEFLIFSFLYKKKRIKCKKLVKNEEK